MTAEDISPGTVCSSHNRTLNKKCKSERVASYEEKTTLRHVTKEDGGNGGKSFWSTVTNATPAKAHTMILTI
jgi:hypothetical protein